MWPHWVVLPLLVGSFLGAVACLYLAIYGTLFLVKPETGRSRLHGLRFFGLGLLCLSPLAATLAYSARLPIVF